LECARLAGALARAKSGSKLTALQTLPRPYASSQVHGCNSRQYFGSVLFP
jgi:hypothetical protein